MKTRLVSLILLITTTSLMAQEPAVSNVRFDQRADGSLKVDIWYDIVQIQSEIVKITIEASADSGATWTLPCSSLTGNVGDITTGSADRHVEWDFYADNPGQSGNQYMVRVSPYIQKMIGNDGKRYDVFQDTCGTWWITENSKETKYRNGDDIPEVNDNATWEGLTTGARCSYDNLESNSDIYGYLYNGWAVDDASVTDGRYFAPAGWRLSDDPDWSPVYYLLGQKVEVFLATTGWPCNGTNTSGIAVLPGGFRAPSGPFFHIGTQAVFWLYVFTGEYGLAIDCATINGPTALYQNGLSIRLVRSNDFNPATVESAAGSLTSMPPSGEPALRSPTDWATGVVEPVVVRWYTSDHLPSYTLQVANDEDFCDVFLEVGNITDTSYTILGLSPSTHYYWHVRASNVAGDSYFCDGWAFETDASLPVELSQFSAESTLEGILLKWTTESETNNLGFVLERFVGADHNPPGAGMWQTIATYQTHDALRGQGNTSSQTDYEFKDLNVESGMTYQYRLSDVDFKGNITINDKLTITLNNDTPDETQLQPAVPNPFNPQTKISYQLAEQSAVTLNVYDMNGRIVSRLLHNVQQSPGTYSIYWHGMDGQEKQAATGTYILYLIAGDVVQSQKVLLMR